MADPSLGKCVLVTGGAGFIGSAVVRRPIQEADRHVLVSDERTSAGDVDWLAPAAVDPRYAVVQEDILDELSSSPVSECVASAPAKAVPRYVDERDWWTRVGSGVYRGERLGVIGREGKA